MSSRASTRKQGRQSVCMDSQQSKIPCSLDVPVVKEIQTVSRKEILRVSNVQRKGI